MFYYQCGHINQLQQPFKGRKSDGAAKLWTLVYQTGTVGTRFNRAGGGSRAGTSRIECDEHRLTGSLDCTERRLKSRNWLLGGLACALVLRIDNTLIPNHAGESLFFGGGLARIWPMLYGSAVWERWRRVLGAYVEDMEEDSR